MNQIKVDNAMKEIVSTLGDDVGIFADNNEICVSVEETDANKVEKILYNNDIDFKKESDEVDGLTISYTFKGRY